MPYDKSNKEIQEARTSGFKLRSGNTSAFKMMGSSPAKAGPETKQVDVDDMVDPFSLDEQAYENAQNDYDTNNPTKEQIAASKKKILEER